MIVPSQRFGIKRKRRKNAPVGRFFEVFPHKARSGWSRVYRGDIPRLCDWGEQALVQIQSLRPKQKAGICLLFVLPERLRLHRRPPHARTRDQGETKKKQPGGLFFRSFSAQSREQAEPSVPRRQTATMRRRWAALAQASLCDTNPPRTALTQPSRRDGGGQRWFRQVCATQTRPDHMK